MRVSFSLAPARSSDEGRKGSGEALKNKKEVANVFEIVEGDVDALEMKGYSRASNYDAAHIIDPDGRIVLRVLEPESRRMDDSFPEERFRQDVRNALRKVTEVIPPYTIQWDPGRDNAEEEFYKDL
ncbi:MAG: hypothetical protein ACOX8A_11715 [Thermacetogeniaceae bacterium]